MPKECWVNILEYLQKDEEINILRLVSKEMLHASMLTQAGKDYYLRKETLLSRYAKMARLSKKDNNYAHFFAANVKTQVAELKEQLTMDSDEFGLTIYFDNSLQADEEKAYLAEQLGTWGSVFISDRIKSTCTYNLPTEYFYKKENGSLNANESNGSGRISRFGSNHLVLIFTINTLECNRLMQLIIENQKRLKHKMPFFIVISLNPLLKVSDFHHPILKLYSISPGYKEKLADAFFLNRFHPDLWTNTSHKYDYYYREKMANVFKEIGVILEELFQVKDSIKENIDNQLMVRQ
ncbi:hypothetical protein [Legionella wadsworthii]|uniref:hypothetical protein n=1 Tax=Legionella wadsworthii TaxID=28088 RepID=UPI000B1ABC39|nr:hypothetical protein [Legionella wadsworthii]